MQFRARKFFRQPCFRRRRTCPRPPFFTTYDMSNNRCPQRMATLYIVKESGKSKTGGNGNEGHPKDSEVHRLHRIGRPRRRNGYSGTAAAPRASSAATGCLRYPPAARRDVRQHGAILSEKTPAKCAATEAADGQPVMPTRDFSFPASLANHSKLCDGICSWPPSKTSR